MLLASCVNGNREYDEADSSAFGTFVHALDTTEQGKYLTHLLDADTSKWEAGRPSVPLSLSGMIGQG